MFKGEDVDRLRFKLKSGHACLLITSSDEKAALDLIGDALVGSTYETMVWSVSRGLREMLLQNGQAVEETDHPAAALYHMTLKYKRWVGVFLDLLAHMDDPRTRRMFREAVDAAESTGSMLILIDHAHSVPAVVEAMASRFDLTLPDEKEIERIVREVARTEVEQFRAKVELTKADLSTIVRNLAGLTGAQIRRLIKEAISEDDRLDASDGPKILARKRQLMQLTGALEHVEAPVSMDQIGGMAKLKDWLKVRSRAGSDEAKKFGISAPRGLLMLGVQGAGKSLSCKAVATAWGRPLIRLDVGALYDKYIGESEKRLREALRQAEFMAPIVLWIDEVEKAFASASSASSNDGGLSRRMFGSLLTWLQEHDAPVFTVATANDVSALPPELLRKGRFDEIFFVDLPQEAARKQIFEIHIKRRGREAGRFDFAALATASEGFSGAEIEQAIVAALYAAFEKREELTTEHVLHAVKTSPPLSVTMSEKIEELRAWASGRCVPAD